MSKTITITLDLSKEPRRFNTGRRYSEHGQRLVLFQALSEGKPVGLYMFDLDRGIDMWLQGLKMDAQEEDILHAYDIDPQLERVVYESFEDYDQKHQAEKIAWSTEDDKPRWMKEEDDE